MNKQSLVGIFNRTLEDLFNFLIEQFDDIKDDVEKAKEMAFIARSTIKEEMPMIKFMEHALDHLDALEERDVSYFVEVAQTQGLEFGIGDKFEKLSQAEKDYIWQLLDRLVMCGQTSITMITND